MNEITGLTLLLLLLLLFCTGIELGFAMAVIGFVGFAYLKGFAVATNLIARDLFDVITNYGYTVFPLFIFMGQIGYHAGIAKNLYDAAHKFIGHIPGGLAIATVLGGSAFKSICGSATATTATFASVAMPEMDRYGYDQRLSDRDHRHGGHSGLSDSSQCGADPLRHHYRTIHRQAVPGRHHSGPDPQRLFHRYYLRLGRNQPQDCPGFGALLLEGTGPLAAAGVPGVADLFGHDRRDHAGLLYPTEAGSVGAFAVLLLALFQGGLSFKKYFVSLSESIRTAGMFLMLLIGSLILGHFIAVTNIPQGIADYLTNLNVNRYVVLLLICLVYELGGTFIEDLAFMILATPIFFPTIVKLGFDPVWFGILISVVIMVGMIIPPVAIAVFVVKNITKVPTAIIYKGSAPFLIGLVLFWGLLLVFPQLALWLPSMFIN